MSQTPLHKRGCRPLKLGETVQAGDLVWFRSRWEEVGADEIGKQIERYSYRHCRPVARTVVAGKRLGDLEAALLGVHWDLGVAEQGLEKLKTGALSLEEAKAKILEGLGSAGANLDLAHLHAKKLSAKSRPLVLRKQPVSEHEVAAAQQAKLTKQGGAS